MTTIAGTTSKPGRWEKAVGVLRRRTWLIVGVSLAGPILAAAVTLAMAGPGSSSPEIVTAVAFLVSLAVGCVAALLLEGPERGLRSAAEVEAVMGLPTLGVVPVAAAQDGRVHLAVGREPATAYAGAVRSVLDTVRAGGPCKVMLVTSTLPGEGKTTLAVSLAALAARSERVLLIDLDLRQPNVHRVLGHEAGAGLVEHVMEGRPLAEVLRRDEATGIDFLPVGAPTLEPSELIESQRMRELLETGRAQYDLVVIDCAPVGIITDARIAAGLADRTLFVVQWRTTEASAALDGARALRDAGVEPAGVVLTRAGPA